MGYSYCNGKLCCDVCGDYGQTRKYKCPFGYCPAIALCPKCKREHPEYTSQEGHRAHDCEKHSQEGQRKEAEKQAIINAGGLVRCAALHHPDKPEPNIKVIFTKQAGESAYFMSEATYDAIPLLVNATPDDYRKYGDVIPAKSLDIYDAEMPEPDGLLAGLAQSLADKPGKPIAIEPAGIHAEPVTTGRLF